MFIALQATGPFATLLLSPPRKVIRKDGTKVKDNTTNMTWLERLKDLYRVFMKPEILCMSPLFLTNVWYSTWSGNYLAHNFSVRARALDGLLGAFLRGMADIVMGYLLDLKRWKRSSRARWGWWFQVLNLSGQFIWGFIIEGIYTRSGDPELD